MIGDKRTLYYDVDFIIGAAVRIIQIEDPISFDEYYFVEKKEKNYKELVEKTKKEFPKKKIFISQEDCNKKLLDLNNYLRNPKNKKIELLHRLILVECRSNGGLLNVYEDYRWTYGF